MAITAGSVDATGAGSGLAKSLWDAWESAMGGMTGTNKTKMATWANATAAAIVTAVKAADVIVPQNGLDPGVPSVQRTLAGAVD